MKLLGFFHLFNTLQVERIDRFLVFCMDRSSLHVMNAIFFGHDRDMKLASDMVACSDA